MKRFAVLLLLIPLSGCLAEVLTTTAIQGELAAENASAASRALDKAKQTAAQTSANNAALFPNNSITPADQQAKEQIRQAINNYGQAVGYYPPSLQALVQYGYLQSVPKTSSGKDFVFHPENGALYHPAELAQQQAQQDPAQQRSGASAGGAGLMGETMTGIGVQNELNSMNNSGVSNTGSAARSGARDQSGTYSDRQMQTLKDLNLDQ